MALLVRAFGDVSGFLAAGGATWIAEVAGVILLGTAAPRRCPLHVLFGIRTCRR
jgi:hypothetical protein